MIYAALWQNEDFSKLTDKEKVLYVGLVTLADDYGRLKANPAILKSQIFMYDDTMKNDQVMKMLKKIHTTGLIVLYDQDRHLFHPNWEKYQILRKDRLTRSLCPSPDNQMTTRRQPPAAEASNRIEESKHIKNHLEQFKPEFLKRGRK